MKSRNMLIGIVLLTSILFTSIVYAAFNAQLTIEGEAIVRSDQDIRITNISISNTTNGAYEIYNNKYNKDVTFMYVTLPSNSSIVYEVEITNKVSDSYLIESITQESHTNSNVNVDISLNINDIVNSNSKKIFTITLTNNTSSEQQETLVYKYEFKLNSFIVTFDANGGQVLNSSKIVSYGSNYGLLPTSEREGYTFQGWNGKNMFNEDNFIKTYSQYYSNKPSKTTFQDFEVLKIYGGINATGRAIKYMEGKFENNTSYTISFDIYDVYLQCIGTKYCVGSIISVNYTDGTLVDLNPFSAGGYVSVSESWKQVKFTSDSSKTIGYISVTFQTTNAYAYIKNFQMEQGSIATSYEPYYIKDTTTVVQPNNHTLTAIWEENNE